MTTFAGRAAGLCACLALFATGLGNAQAAPAFTITKLISNQQGQAQNFDPNLVNAWGIAHLPGGPLWVNENGTGLSSVFDRDSGKPLGLEVQIPGGDPTGIVAVPQDSGDNDDFLIRENGVKGKSLFIFVTESGVISGWNNNVDLNHAIARVDLSKEDAVFKGVAITGEAGRLYAADFTNNLVRIFDDHFRPIGAFTDPALPKRFAPFNVTVIHELLYVTFAKRERGGDDEVDGPGLGYVDVFSKRGQLMKRLIANGPLNAPWGLSLAPPNFGGLDGSLLVGNFGDGRINAFNIDTGDFLGALQDTNGKPLKIDGLWGIGENLNGSVEFAAGPDDEANGLVGRIAPAGTKIAH